MYILHIYICIYIYILVYICKYIYSLHVYEYIYVRCIYMYISKICIYLRRCIDMGVPRWEWADEGGEIGVGIWELREGSGVMVVGR